MTASEATSGKPARAGHWLVPLCAALAGALVRLPFVLRSDFPLNDGGMFYLMTQELQRASYRLPAYTAYNGAGIPFAYPPLGLYLAGLTAGLGPWSLVDVFRFLPLALTLLSIPAFYALARALLADEQAAALAAFAFALLPNSYSWQIMGGGVTRAAGMLFAILAIQQAHALYTRGERRYILTAGLCAGLTVLGHLAMAWLVAVSIGLLFLAYGRSRKALGRSLLVAAVAAAASAPWWGAVLARHGLAPFLAASQSSESPAAGLLYLLTQPWTEEPRFPLLAGLALLGLLACLVRRRFVLPAWLVLLFIADPRTVGATSSLPLALLAGLGASDVVLPLVNGEAGLGPAKEGHATRSAWDPARNRLARLVLSAMLVYAAWSSLDADASILVGLSPDERAAMAWVAENTPQSSTFLVLSGHGTWGADALSEWFPVLAGRVSAGTVQGQEWFEGFVGRAYAYAQLQACTAGDAARLEAWARGAQVAYDYVYVARRQPGGAAPALADALRHQPGYRIAYDGPGAVVFSRQVAAALQD